MMSKCTNETIAAAMEFARECHGDQMYGDKPYVYHLDAVAEFCRPYGRSAVLLAYLHDVIEDTDADWDGVAGRFGIDVASAVQLLSDVPSGSRGERKAQANVKFAAVDANGPMSVALIVKAADRMANVRESVETGNAAKFAMYQREHAAFREAVYRVGQCPALWTHLDNLIAIPALA